MHFPEQIPNPDIEPQNPGFWERVHTRRFVGALFGKKAPQAKHTPIIPEAQKPIAQPLESVAEKLREVTFDFESFPHPDDPAKSILEIQSYVLRFKYGNEWITYVVPIEEYLKYPLNFNVDAVDGRLKGITSSDYATMHGFHYKGVVAFPLDENNFPVIPDWMAEYYVPEEIEP